MQRISTPMQVATRLLQRNVRTPADYPPYVLRAHPRAPPLPTADPDVMQECRSCLRSLLRECSYLPDPFAREYLSRYILRRYRTYLPKARDPFKSIQENSRFKSQRTKARRSLGKLRRANEGERKDLLRALLLTYGRLGARRRELVAQVTKELDFDVDKDPDSPLAKRTPVLHALVQSQMGALPPELTRPNPRTLGMTIPGPTLRKKKLTPTRLEKLQAKFKADVYARALPPLPRPEWQRLRDLARGVDLPASVHVPRRTVGTGAPPPKSSLEHVIERGKINPRTFGSQDGHAITPRYMQRLWAQVFGQCPMMEWKPETGEWKITWGEHALYEKLDIVEEQDEAE